MKKALVTGGSGGIGAAICRALARDGWEVVVGYHEQEELARELAAELGGVALGADLSDEGETRAMMDAAGELELLVNCAGIAWAGLFQDMGEETWHRLFQVNVDSMFRCCRLAVPGMIRRQSGCILNIASVLGLTGGSCESAYSATKGAIIAFTKSLAKELGPSGIRANCICPGCIDTPMLAGYSPLEKQDLIDRTTLGRLGRGEDVAELAAFLASERASFITAQAISVDGGFII